jgi:hypothetical protein
MAQRIHNPQFRMHYLENGVRVLVVQTPSSGTFGLEFNAETAAATATLLLAPHPGHHLEPVW